MANSGKTLSFTEHLEELRKRLILCLSVFIIASIASYSFVDRILPLLTKPVRKLVFISPAETFLAYINIALFLGFFISLPVILFEAWQFVSSALKPGERKYALLFGPMSLVFFLCGAAFAYVVVLPIGMNFLLGFATPEIEPMISIKYYISFVSTILIAFGVLFELPLAVLFLSKLGLVTPAYLVSKWRHAIVIIFIVAAILTPPDVITQVLMAVPLIALYFISILFSWLVYKGKSGVAG